MKVISSQKYQPFPQVDLPNRQWPNKAITVAPTWCSVDLRDGNQALVEPMGDERKQRMYDLLLELGFKEIEIGFPAASQTDFDFLRKLIDEDRIPEDVTLQVLVQAREHLIARTFEGLKGIKRAIVHVYNSTSTLQRDVVFKQSRDGVKDIAIQGAKWVQEYSEKYPETEWVFQYSPESFTGTELDYAVEVCDAVCDVWKPTKEHQCIINLPATVEMSLPNVYADQIEWFLNNTRYKDEIILSVHTHNDRGCGVAASELAQLAGATRVEGTLFGNGERTGNVDIITLGLNLHTQGVDPQLNLSNINAVKQTVEYCNRLEVHPRHPYVGELVFTAFSGSHQDAIKKGFDAYQSESDQVWGVPYLAIDPADLGRSYEAIIRVNSQSGKGGVAYLLEADYGIRLPRKLQIDFSQVIQSITDSEEKEVSSNEIFKVFTNEYLENLSPLEFVSYESHPEANDMREIHAVLHKDGKELILEGEGNGPIDAYVNALKGKLGIEFRFVDYQEHSVREGEDSSAYSYIELEFTSNGINHSIYGVSKDKSIVKSSLKALTVAINRAYQKGFISF